MVDYRQQTAEILNSRISPEGLLRTNINSAIANYTMLANNPDCQTMLQNGTTVAEAYFHLLNIFVYIRDTYGAQTVGEAFQVIIDGKIESKVMQLWLDEELCRGILEQAVLSALE